MAIFLDLDSLFYTSTTHLEIDSINRKIINLPALNPA